MNENEVISSIEGSKKVYEAEIRDLLMSNCCVEVIVERKESSFR